MASQERMMVLRMLEEKRISAGEAEELLAALDRAEAERRQAGRQGTGGERKSEGDRRSEPEFDFGEIGRGLRDAFRQVADSLGGLAGGGSWARDIGDRVRAASGEATVTVERDIIVPAEPGDAPRRVIVALGSGSLSIRGTDSPAVTGRAVVTVRGRDQASVRGVAEGIVAQAARRGDAVEVSVRSPADGPEGHGPWRAPRLDCRLELALPRRSALLVTTESASVSIGGVVGAIEVRTGSGNVAVAALRGEARVRTASGNVTLRIAPDARLRVEAATAGGAIGARAPLTVERFARTSFAGVQGGPDALARVETASGDIAIESDVS